MTRASARPELTGLFLAVFLAALTPEARAQFPDAHDAPPAGWTGRVFKLRQDYPASLPPAGPLPWKQFDFKTEPTRYLKAVLDYALEGNVEVDWQAEQNEVRDWYHAPWMHSGPSGREFVHGLTRERSSRPRELDPRQSSTFSNYAVSLYNARGGFTIGRVWRDPENPDASAARFPEGTVAIKLLFTTATVSEVPYLRNAFRWRAHLARATGSGREIQTARLLQIDVAVRDSRADDTTGWVFGTFSYDGNAPGQTPWERMVPIGVMWGNDPDLTPQRFEDGERPQETVVVNRNVGTTQHLGFLERLNGPVDNRRSSCLSCHSTAQHETRSAPVPGTDLPDDQKMRWFRNIRSGRPFDAGQESLDYSLQLSTGIQRFFDSRN